MMPLLALASWKLWQGEGGKGQRDFLYHSLRFSRWTNVRGHVGSRGKGITGIAAIDGTVARATGARLGRSEGYKPGEQDSRKQLLGGRHISVFYMRVLQHDRVGGQRGERNCLLL